MRRLAWTCLGFLLLMFAKGYHAPSGVAAAAGESDPGESVPVVTCSSNIFHVKATFQAFDLGLDVKRPARSGGTLGADVTFDYSGGVTEDGLPKDSKHEVEIQLILSWQYAGKDSDGIKLENFFDSIEVANQAKKYDFNGTEVRENQNSNQNTGGKQVAEAIVEAFTDFKEIHGDKVRIKDGFRKDLNMLAFLGSVAKHNGEVCESDDASKSTNELDTGKGQKTAEGK